MSIRQTKTALRTPTLESGTFTTPQAPLPSKSKRPSTPQYSAVTTTSTPTITTAWRHSLLIKTIIFLILMVVTLVLAIDYIHTEASTQANHLQSQLAVLREREDRVWNMGYEAGEKLGRYKVSIDVQEGDSEAWAAWKEGFKKGEELGKRVGCERIRF